MILGIVALGLAVIGRWDRPLAIDRKGRLWILAGAAAELAGVAKLAGGQALCERILWAVLGGCLLLACITDSLICQVYNFTWWIALAAVLPLWCSRQEPGAGMAIWLENQIWLMFFVGLQLFLGGRIYGRADGYAFCICAVAEAAAGMSLTGVLIQMLSAYTLLFMVQAIRRNINKRGNLFSKVPFLPYITVSFWLVLLLNHHYTCNL